MLTPINLLQQPKTQAIHLVSNHRTNQLLALIQVPIVTTLLLIITVSTVAVVVSMGATTLSPHRLSRATTVALEIITSMLVTLIMVRVIVIYFPLEATRTRRISRMILMMDSSLQSQEE
jgi:hypothetical protein